MSGFTKTAHGTNRTIRYDKTCYI